MDIATIKKETANGKQTEQCVLHCVSGSAYITDKELQVLELVYRRDWPLACKCLKILCGCDLKTCRAFLDSHYR